MIISHKHKFIFVKTKKTAGTSFEIALSKICGPDDILTPIDHRDEVARMAYAGISAQNYFLPWKQYTWNKMFDYLAKKKRLPLRFYPHISCQKIRDWVEPEIWESYYKFTIERNPFDKIVSLYYWRNGDKKFGNIYDFIKGGGLSDFSSYDIYAADGLPAVDKIYRYEDLGFACEDLTRRLQLEEPLRMPSYRAKFSERREKGCQELLDERSIELIRMIFAREFQLLGYEF